MDTVMQPGEHLLDRMSSALREKAIRQVKVRRALSLIAEAFQSHKSDGQQASCREDGKLCICIVFQQFNKILYRPAGGNMLSILKK